MLSKIKNNSYIKKLQKYIHYCLDTMHSDIERNKKADKLAKDTANDEQRKTNKSHCINEDILRLDIIKIGTKWWYK